jgi:hypothetical protein
MTVLEQARADISALIYRHTPRGQLPSSVRLRELLAVFEAAARGEGALAPGEAPAVAVGRSEAQLRADLAAAADTLERAARAVRAMSAGNPDAAALAVYLDEEVAGFRTAAA